MSGTPEKTVSQNRFAQLITDGFESMDADLAPSPRPSRIGIDTSKGETIFTDELKIKFLQLVAQYGQTGRAAAACGVHFQTPLRHRKQDPEFEEAVVAALDIYREVVVSEVHRRAIEGVVEDVWHNGEVVGSKRVYSDRLLAMLAKRVDPGFRDQVDVNAKVQADVMVIPAPANSMEAMEAEAKRIAVEADR